MKGGLDGEKPGCSEDKQQGRQSGHQGQKKMALRVLVGPLAAPMPSEVSKKRGKVYCSDEEMAREEGPVKVTQRMLRAENSCSHLSLCSGRLRGPWH